MWHGLKLHCLWVGKDFKCHLSIFPHPLSSLIQLFLLNFALGRSLPIHCWRHRVLTQYSESSTVLSHCTSPSSSSSSLQPLLAAPPPRCSGLGLPSGGSSKDGTDTSLSSVGLCLELLFFFVLLLCWARPSISFSYKGIFFNLTPQSYFLHCSYLKKVMSPYIFLSCLTEGT